MENLSVKELNTILETNQVSFLDFTIKISDVKVIDSGYRLIYTIVHYGLENDKRLTKHNLTGVTIVNVINLEPDTIIKATYVAILQKLRHEAAELFKVNGVDIFNEHYPVNNNGEGFPMVESIIG